MPRARLPTIVLALAVLSACGREDPPAAASTPGAAARPPDIVAVVGQDPVAPEVVTLRFTAPAAHALAIDNCNGAMSWALERQQDSQWHPAWGAETDACLSAALVIAAGQSRDYEVAVDKRAASLPAGTYRVVVHGLYAGADPRGAGADTLLPVERRTTAPFRFDPAARP